MTRFLNIEKIIEFKLIYLLIAAGLFLIETYIAIWVHDGFVRPYLGDFIVPLFLYCLFRGLFTGSKYIWIFSSFGICYVIEILQGFQIVEKLGLSNFKLAVILIGTSFSIEDLAAYTAGAGTIVLFEKMKMSKYQQ
ncbi:MAG: DUF2809 domain-containing protein [Deltaproteobacteria bacterium]|nr:DUF2809 domain-containing protein [Deltaproteobacteria bacterium]